MAKRAHRAVDPLQGQRKHALLDQAPDHADTDGPLPVRLGNRVEPDRTGIGREQAGEPYRARLVVPALDAAPFLLDLVGAHAGVADQHEAPALVIGAQQLEDRQRRLAAAARVAPYPIVHAIVKVEMDQMLELGTGGREQLFAKPDVILHRSADIEQQQQLYGIVPLGDEPQVEPTGIVRGRAHGAGAGETAQAPEGELHIAGAEREAVVEIAELAAVPCLDGAALAALFASDAHALRVVAVGAERRGAGGADPCAAALVPLFLFGEAPAQRLHHFFPAAEGGDLFFLLLGEMALGEFFEPFLGQVRHRIGDAFAAVEALSEDAVEAVEMALVLDERGARQKVEALDIVPGDALVHRLQQGQVFAQRYRYPGPPQLEKERDEHRPNARAG